MTEKMPSSTRFGSRPSAWRTRAYSSSESPWAATISGVIPAMRRALARLCRNRQTIGGFVQDKPREPRYPRATGQSREASHACLEEGTRTDGGGRTARHGERATRHGPGRYFAAAAIARNRHSGGRLPGRADQGFKRRSNDPVVLVGHGFRGVLLQLQGQYGLHHDPVLR